MFFHFNTKYSRQNLDTNLKGLSIYKIIKKFPKENQKLRSNNVRVLRKTLRIRIKKSQVVEKPEIYPLHHV